jgi:ABC-type Fe3+/spermidine/putrescine transport system ATPase subunit
MTVVVDLDHLTKTFDSTVAVNDVTLRIESGEFMAVVGPTGCGKTTILRLVAGLETPTAGEVRFDNASMNGVDSSQRGVRMVFQNYALYPHLPVFRERGFSNLGFPLNLRRTRGAELTARIDAVAARAGVLRRLFPRKPAQLSSGEQQKVALGRALSLPPRVLLLDEPFSNLDAISRHRAQEELRSEHAKSRVTTLHVTHSLHEAFRLADRIAVMEAGRIVQVGTPEQLRDHPSCDVVKALLESSR